MFEAEFVRITLDRERHLATVVLDRPPVNAMNAQLFTELAGAMDALGDEPQVRAAVLASASPRAFLAGLDLAPKSPIDPPAPAPPWFDPGGTARRCFSAILDCAVPVVAAVEGPALGGGLVVAACCDIIVASERAEFGLPEIDLGLLGGAAFLLRMVGPYRMRQAFFTAERLPAEELYRFGAVSSVVPVGSALTAATDLAARIATRSPSALRMAKQVLYRIERLPLEDAYRLEQDVTARLAVTPDARDARRAWRERRSPRFDDHTSS